MNNKFGKYYLQSRKISFVLLHKYIEKISEMMPVLENSLHTGKFIGYIGNQLKFLSYFISQICSEIRQKHKPACLFSMIFFCLALWYGR
jgi:hypothetical protein